MATILVTGSEGNIGTYLVSYLQKKHPSHTIVRVRQGETMSRRKSDTLYTGNLCNLAFVRRIFEEQRIDFVIHLAAKLYGVAGFNKDVYGIFYNDLQSLLNVLHCSRGIKKFIYLSSSMVYESSEKVPFTEELTDTILPPRSSYGLTKFFGEKAIKFFDQQHGLNYTIWRPFNVVSPLEPHDREGAHVFVDFYRKIFVNREPKIEIYGSGSQVRCFTWVEDVVEGIVENLTNPHTDRETFNIGSTEPKNMIELKDLLLQIGKEKGSIPKDYNPETITGTQFFGVDVQLRIPSVEKIKKILGWEHTTDFKACFEKFIEFKQRHGH